MFVGTAAGPTRRRNHPASVLFALRANCSHMMGYTPLHPADDWERDVTLLLVGWLLATILAVALLLTVVRWLLT